MDRLNKINWNGYNVNPGDLYPLDYDNNGQIDQNDRVVIGSTDPKFYGGFSTDFSWKGLSLNAVFSYSYGAKKLSPWYETLIGSTGSGVASTDLLDRWTPEIQMLNFHVCWLALIIIIMVQVLWILVYRKLLSCVCLL